MLSDFGNRKEELTEEQVDFFVQIYAYVKDYAARRDPEARINLRASFAHAENILQAIEGRGHREKGLQGAFQILGEREFILNRDRIKHLILDKFSNGKDKDQLDKDNLEELIEEAFVIAGKKKGKIVSVQSRWKIYQQQLMRNRAICAARDNVEDLYDGPVKACIDLPWSLG